MIQMGILNDRLYKNLDIVALSDEDLAQLHKEVKEEVEKRRLRFAEQFK